MSEEPPSSTSLTNRHTRTWLERILSSFAAGPRSHEELLQMVKGAADNKVVDQEALHIIEGALDVANRQVRDIMIPRSQMVIINEEDSPSEFLPQVIESGHSRFPVIGETIDDVKGILLAKDLLPLILEGEQSFEYAKLLRTANVIPESKRLNVLLKEFRENRYHMALVIDEYGGISGLVTIEDILEEIVGEIEDETDEDEDEGFIRRVADNDFIVKALTPIEEFNEYFKSHFSEEEFDTISGIVMQAFGHMPARNEQVTLKDLAFRVLYSDNRKIHLLKVKRVKTDSQAASD